MSAQPLLEVENLSVAFGEGGEQKIVVREASFAVAEGEIFGIVGGSGSGKTTTLRTILRRLPRGAHVLSGEVRYRGRDLLPLSDNELRGIRGSKVSIIVQNPIAALDPLRRVGSQLRGLARQHGRALSREQMRELMLDVGIVDSARVLRAYPHELSGGMAQRVLISAALALEPELILADEPTSALDVTIQAQIMELVTALVKKRGLTFVLVTHDIALVSEYCDRVLVMHEGRIVESGPVERVIHEPQDDYTRDLVASVVVSASEVNEANEVTT